MKLPIFLNMYPKNRMHKKCCMLIKNEKIIKETVHNVFLVYSLNFKVIFANLFFWIIFNVLQIPHHVYPKNHIVFLLTIIYKWLFCKKCFLHLILYMFECLKMYIHTCIDISILYISTKSLSDWLMKIHQSTEPNVSYWYWQEKHILFKWSALRVWGLLLSEWRFVLTHVCFALIYNLHFKW